MNELYFIGLGYLAIFAYVFFMIFVVGKALQKKFSTEVSRKVVHISLFMVWVFIDLFMKNTPHQIAVTLIFLGLNVLSYFFKIFGSIERNEDDGENHFGTIYFAVAMFIIMTVAYLNPYLFPYTGFAVFALTFGDGFAALIGHTVKSKKIYYSKSIAGFIACVVATFVSLSAFKLIYGIQITFLNVFVLAVLTAILELVYFGLDNFSITIPIMIASYCLTTFSNQSFYVSVYVAIAIFFIVFFTNAIDYLGSLAATAIVFIFGYIGNYHSLIFLLGCYFTIFVISKISKHIRKKKESRPRDVFQILINGGLGSLLMIYSAYSRNAAFYVCALIAIAGCFIDSVSSDVGVLSKKKPYDFINRKHREPGRSGAVTALGTFSAIIGSILCAVAIHYIAHLHFLDTIVVAILIYLQSFIDTIFGATLQVTYSCSKCGKTVERQHHCGSRAIHMGGVYLFDNNMVNLATSFIICILSIIYFATPAYIIQ